MAVPVGNHWHIVGDRTGKAATRCGQPIEGQYPLTSPLPARKVEAQFRCASAGCASQWPPVVTVLDGGAWEPSGRLFGS